MLVSAIVSFIAKDIVILDIGLKRIMLWLMVIIPWSVPFCIVLCYYYEFPKFNALPYTPSSEQFEHKLSSSYITLMITVISASLIYFINVTKRVFRIMHSHYKLMARLHAMSTLISGNLYELKSARPYAFAAGTFKKRCYISQGLIDSLSKDELSVVVSHEQAHIKLNDPIKKNVFNFFAMFFPLGLSKRLHLQMTLSMEQAADVASTDNECPPIFVAETLIKVARLCLKYDQVNAERNDELLVSFGSDVLSHRIKFLIDKTNTQTVSKLFLIIYTLSLLVVAIFFIESIHHFIEVLVFN